MKDQQIGSRLLEWYDMYQRTLPWRGTHDPYEIWVSEVMLQQTRTETVERYYARFLERYPDVQSLAAASEQEVLKMWEGLGYYRRAKALRQGAQEVVERFGGEMPKSYVSLLKLTGIGDYTASAIASISSNEPVPAVDGNAVRVYSRLAGYIECVDTARGKRTIHEIARRCLDAERPGDFNQAIMDLGSSICIPGRPKCDACPLQFSCACGSEEMAAPLPIKKEKKKQNVEEWDVLLVRQGSTMAVVQRKEALLEGLWTFPMRMHADTPPEGKGIETWSETGRARHVFTHKIWDMHLIRVSVSPEYAFPTEWHMVSWEELNALPFPSAMRSAMKEAGRFVSEEKGS